MHWGSVGLIHRICSYRKGFKHFFLFWSLQNILSQTLELPEYWNHLWSMSKCSFGGSLGSFLKNAREYSGFLIPYPHICVVLYILIRVLSEIVPVKSLDLLFERPLSIYLVESSHFEDKKNAADSKILFIEFIRHMIFILM